MKGFAERAQQIRCLAHCEIKKEKMRILAVGDVFGSPGLEFVRKNLRRIKNAEGADLVIVNAENAHEGSGLEKLEAEILIVHPIRESVSSKSAIRVFISSLNFSA